MTSKRKRVRARAVLVGDVFKPVVDKLDAGASAEAIASTVVDIVDADEDRVVRLPELLHLTGLSKSTIYRKIGRGTFPYPVSLGGTGRRPHVGWFLREVRAWLRTRARSRTD